MLSRASGELAGAVFHYLLVPIILRAMRINVALSVWFSINRMQYLCLQEAYPLHTAGYTVSWKRLAQFCSVIRAHSVQGQSKEVRWSLTQETCSLPTNNQTTKHAERWSPSIIQENTFVQLPVASRSMVCPLFLAFHLCVPSLRGAKLPKTFRRLRQQQQ